MSNEKQPTVWLGKTNFGEDTEVGLSEKGYVGIWIKGRWQGGMTASTLKQLLKRADDLSLLADKGIEISGKAKENKQQAKMDAKLLREAEALKQRALKLAQAGIDLHNIFAAKEQA
jgi:hypothetical protein